jgi:hypothetical protein
VCVSRGNGLTATNNIHDWRVECLGVKGCPLRIKFTTRVSRGKEMPATNGIHNWCVHG